jgi:uncharacterized protein YndB with AHSA1/START domain
LPGANESSSVTNGRTFRCGARQIFAAFAQPDCLAAWWGPKDFANTFQQFDFKVGGRWVFTMHGPNGADFANENVFREIEPYTRLVIEHTSLPWYRLTVTLTPRGDSTYLVWNQEFESPEFAAKIRRFASPPTNRTWTASNRIWSVPEPFPQQAVSAAYGVVRRRPLAYYRKAALSENRATSLLLNANPCRTARSIDLASPCIRPRWE